MRHALLPALRALHPAAEANVLRTLELLRDEAAVLDAVLDAALAEAGEPPAAAALRALPPALRRLALQRLADAPRAGGRAARSATARTRCSRSPRAARSTSAAGCAPRCAAVRSGSARAAGPAAPHRDRGAA